MQKLETEGYRYCGEVGSEQMKIGLWVMDHIKAEIVEMVVVAKKFLSLIEKLVKQNNPIQSINITGVEMFGKNQLVGFITLKVIYFNPFFNKSNYLYLRGNSVAILIFVNGKLLLLEQYRATVQHTATEPPAGMLDQSGDFVGAAAKQIEEETGIAVTQDKLQYLGEYYTIPDACDEIMYMYCCHIQLSEEKMQEVENNIHGNSRQREKIKVKFVDYDPRIILASKSGPLIALALAYEKKYKKS